MGEQSSDQDLVSLDLQSHTIQETTNTHPPDLSTTKFHNETTINHAIEPRVFKGWKNIMGGDKEKKKGGKKKQEEDDMTAPGAAGPSDDVPRMKPPARYTGPVPNGMGQEPELSFWVSVRL